MNHPFDTPEDPSEKADELVARADDLNQRLTEASPALDEVLAYQKRSRALLRAFMVLAGVVLVVTVVVFVFIFQVHENSRNIDIQKENAKQACLSGNTFRANEIKLWNYIFQVSAERNPNLTPEQQQKNEEIRLNILKIFEPRNCDDLDSLITEQPPPTVTLPLPVPPATN